MTTTMTTEQDAQAPTEVGPGVAAGWYDDPASASHVRWWNGVAWTEHVSEKPDGAAAAAAMLPPVEQPMSHTEQLRSGLSPASTGTASSWFIAFSPLIAAALALAAVYVYFYIVPNAAIFALAGISYLLTLGLAFLDVRTLKQRGFQPISFLFALGGGLVYLVARRLKTAGNAALISFLGLAVIVVGVPGLLAATGAARPIVTSVQVQGNIWQSIIRPGLASNLTCPALMDLTVPGAIYTCTVDLDRGQHSTITVAVNDNQGNYSFHLNQ